MKILFIPYGTEEAPATRYRVMQYLPHLRERGIDYSVFSAISKFSTALMIKSPGFAPFTRFLYYMYVSLERLLRFIYIITAAGRYNVIFLQRTTFPLRLEIFLKMANKNIIFDIDDAIYLPDTEAGDITTRIKKYVKEREVIDILKVAKAVIVENEYIKDFVSRYCRHVSKIPGPIDTERFFTRPENKTDVVVVGWIGTPATTPYLHMLDDVFKTISERYGFVKFKFIGLGKYDNPYIEFDRIDWKYDTELANLQTFDIGIMPMPNNEWTRGKLGCKMLQYMACGIPAVVSFTPTNEEIIKNGENGFFATTGDEWIRVMSQLIEDGSLRRSMGRKGRETVVGRCSLPGNINRLLDVIYKTG